MRRNHFFTSDSIAPFDRLDFDPDVIARKPFGETRYNVSVRYPENRDISFRDFDRLRETDGVLFCGVEIER